MNTIRFNWRWIALIAFFIILASARRIPWPIPALTLTIAGGYMLHIGWRTWLHNAGLPTHRHVTYWRGQRYELGPSKSGPLLPRWSDIGPALIYLLLGGVLILTAVSLALQRLGA